MDHDFCPDCGHLLSRIATRCSFCGWSDRMDDVAGRNDDGEDLHALVYSLTDDVYPGCWVML